jgi:hypothetical protein
LAECAGGLDVVAKLREIMVDLDKVAAHACLPDARFATRGCCYRLVSTEGSA